MPLVPTELDVREVKNSLQSCLKMPFGYLDIEKTTLVIKISASYITSLEELVTIGTIASYFDLDSVKIIRDGVILYSSVKDIQDLANGVITPEDFVEKLVIDGF